MAKRAIDVDLRDAVQDGDFEATKQCFNKGATWPRDLQYTILHGAVYGNNKQVIEFILDKMKKNEQGFTFTINAEDTDADTPLMWAAAHGCVTAAQILLNHGADPELTNKEGRTALGWANSKGNKSVAKLLVKGESAGDIAGQVLVGAAAVVVGVPLLVVGGALVATVAMPVYWALKVLELGVNAVKGVANANIQYVPSEPNPPPQIPLRRNKAGNLVVYNHSY